MEHTYKELKSKTVAQLREIAKDIDHEAVKGYTQLNKDHLLEAICKALNIDMYEHHVAVGIDKTSIKKQIKELKNKRDQAIADKNKEALREARKNIKKLKKKLRKAMV